MPPIPSPPSSAPGSSVPSMRCCGPRCGILWRPGCSGVHVANTVATWVHADYVTADVILAGLLGASVWDLLTWYLGLPTSSSHALLGGFAGAALTSAQHWAGVLEGGKVLITVEFIVIAPFIGLALALAFIVALSWTFRRAAPQQVDRLFRLVQLGSAAAYSLGHGTNDAQKTMGIIAARGTRRSCRGHLMNQPETFEPHRRDTYARSGRGVTFHQYPRK
jgi:PiT family inorganic phosphate transporter